MIDLQVVKSINMEQSLNLHTQEKKFVEEDRNLLDFVLKYSEIIKYANESSTGYDYYTKEWEKMQ